MRSPLAPSPLQVWAVEETCIQLTWGHLPAGEVSAWTGDSHATVEHRGGAGSVDIEGLTPGNDYRIDVTWAGGRGQLRASTLRPPPGELLCKIATISDLHLGSDHWGASKAMVDRSGHETPFPTRCAEAAVREAEAWGAELLVVKGDGAHHQHPEHFAALGELLDGCPGLPVMLIPGNHDVDGHTTHPTPAKIGERGIPFIRDTISLDLPGLRVIAADTTIPGRGIGSIDRVAEDIIELAGIGKQPFFLGLHHHLQPHPLPTYYPIGVGWPPARAFLNRLAATNARGFVSSGHTHRNRARFHGSLCLTEVASTRDWPGVWAGYAVYEGGIRQVVRRTASPDAMAWTEYSRRALLGLWQRWAPGPLGERSMVHEWASSG